jgi:pSer/pThr/pTyr-binding forkhead associated (FHA) protein
MIVPRAEMMQLIGGAARQGYELAAPVSAPPIENNGARVAVSNGSRQIHPPKNALIAIMVDGKIVNERPLNANKTALTIGRHASNDIVVPSQRVSRLHTTLNYTDGAWWIKDEGSLNGLVYQGQRVSQHVLRHGDRIYLAPSVLLYYKETV